ncbi:MAG: glycosyltransferase, partial [Chitinophagaceae bacterium]
MMGLASYKVFPAHLGGQKAVVHFYKHLNQLLDVQMVVSSDNDASNELSVSPILFGHRRMCLNVLQLFQLKKKLQKQKIQCIVAEHSYTGWIAFLLKKFRNLPFILHSHNIEASRFQQMKKKGWRMYRYYEKWIHRKADFNFFKTSEDLEYAVHHYKLNPEKCLVIPYGVYTFRVIENARELLRHQFDISSQFVFYFNGTLDYYPNAKALEMIIDHLHPLLQAKGMDYTFLISGKPISTGLLKKIAAVTNIKYLGFIDDINLLYQGADLFLNPVLNDSGVKTKVVEALSNHCTVVSFQSGASGMPEDVCGQKLYKVE